MWDNAFQYRMKHTLILTSSKRHSSSPIQKRCPTIWHSFVVILFHHTLHECVALKVDLVLNWATPFKICTPPVEDFGKVHHKGVYLFLRDF